jgi:hypothetical protein
MFGITLATRLKPHTKVLSELIGFGGLLSIIIQFMVLTKDRACRTKKKLPHICVKEM